MNSWKLTLFKIHFFAICLYRDKQSEKNEMNYPFCFPTSNQIFLMSDCEATPLEALKEFWLYQNTYILEDVSLIGTSCFLLRKRKLNTFFFQASGRVSEQQF